MMSNKGISLGPIWNNGPAPGNFYDFPRNQSNAKVGNDFGHQRLR